MQNVPPEVDVEARGLFFFLTPSQKQKQIPVQKRDSGVMYFQLVASHRTGLIEAKNISDITSFSLFNFFLTNSAHNIFFFFKCERVNYVFIFLFIFKNK